MTSVPSICQFEVDDAEDEWVYNEKFNFIHGRALFSCFKDPPIVFRKAFDALASGGYFEMQDVWFRALSPDGKVGPTFTKWIALLVENAEKAGPELGWSTPICPMDARGWVRRCG